MKLLYRENVGSNPTKGAKEVFMNRQLKFKLTADGIVYRWGGMIDAPYLPKLSILEFVNRSQQFTGCYDKNGKEIYEGDKLKWSRFIFLVLYRDGGFFLERQLELVDEFLMSRVFMSSHSANNVLREWEVVEN